MGLPPEIAGALGMVAVWISHSLFDRLVEWSGVLGGEVAKKFIVDTTVEKLKSWLLGPS